MLNPTVPSVRFDPLVDEMCEAEPKEQTRWARMVLAYDRENIDALIVLAEHAGSIAESIALLREAVRIGNNVWGPALKGNVDVEWWWHSGTRPFMRAIMAYGNALAETGLPDQAALCYKALLSMQPGDSLGAGEELERVSSATGGPRLAT
jgi:hypothetical protein